MTTKTQGKTGSVAAPRPFLPGVAKPAIRALESAGYTHLDQLDGAREDDLMALHGMGAKALGILKAALQEQGKSLRS